jgi:hypothetical protein
MRSTVIEVSGGGSVSGSKCSKLAASEARAQHAEDHFELAAGDQQRRTEYTRGHVRKVEHVVFRLAKWSGKSQPPRPGRACNGVATLSRGAGA